MAVGALIGAYQEDDQRRASRAASARRPNAARISGALRRGRRRRADRRRRRARAAGAAGCVRAAAARRDRRVPGQRRQRSGQPVRGRLDDPADRRRRRAAGRARRAAWPRSPSRRSRPFPTTRRTRPSSGSTRESRWAGVALVDAHLLGSTAAMLGDWDLQSTLLRRAIQEGALRVPVADETAASRCWSRRAEQLDGFPAQLWSHASRGARTDWASRYLLPPVEEFATEQLMETPVRPAWLIWAALALTLGGAFCFTPRLARRRAWPAARSRRRSTWSPAASRRCG